MSGERPRAREEGLLVRDLGGEMVVYDLESHRGHSLNRTAALVWRACDGRRSVAGIAAQIGRELRVPAHEPLVRYTLRRLGQAGLLDSPVEERTLTRRELARRIGQIALLPVVVSLLAPSPSEAATCGCVSPSVCDCTGVPNGPPWTSCWNGSDCSTYVCCNGSCSPIGPPCF